MFEPTSSLFPHAAQALPTPAHQHANTFSPACGSCGARVHTRRAWIIQARSISWSAPMGSSSVPTLPYFDELDVRQARARARARGHAHEHAGGQGGWKGDERRPIKGGSLQWIENIDGTITKRWFVYGSPSKRHHWLCAIYSETTVDLEAGSSTTQLTDVSFRRPLTTTYDDYLSFQLTTCRRVACVTAKWELVFFLAWKDARLRKPCHLKTFSS